MRNGTDKAETLQREITHKLLTAVTTKTIETKVLHIKGLDEVTTKGEVVAAIIRETEAKPEIFEARTLRPAYRNKQKSTIIFATYADILLSRGRIKVG